MKIDEELKVLGSRPMPVVRVLWQHEYRVGLVKAESALRDAVAAARQADQAASVRQELESMLGRVRGLLIDAG